ncbi:hypothetical protein SUGI_0658570 [Cryptomeria japonica]|uniref:uncharacterized protein LOC131068672 n=1 Tax=Cryptomeria japonica TaxID=3369 RepID=UPI002414CBA2|nr:uncharacterized protein LOC131068672 [Cryptomeria japonica]GLJ32726.1 hypothetical protein SUGI_0658570 [Cryptomeria japonica]
MRIRKRSIAALSSSSWEKTGSFTSEAAAAAAAKEKEFLLPLVAAVVDIQAKARFEGKDCTITPTARHAIAQIHTRPVPKWRNALFRSKAKALQADEEENDKPIYKWNEREQVVDAPKKQRSKLLITHVSQETEDAIEMRKKETMSRKKEKVPEENKNMHAGSQCRRRNGRGWRCSERTLVGYHLCEHHLGKGRLRSINNNNNNTGAVVVKDKGTKFKDLQLIHAAAPPL